jgi:hypothetical protein
LKISRAGLIYDTTALSPLEIPVENLTPQRWALIPQKDLTSRYLQRIYYDRNWTAGLAGLFVHPIPTDCGVCALVLYSQQAVTAFVDYVTEYTAPNGYAEAALYNLAIRLAPVYGGLKDAEIKAMAKSSMATIKIPNSPVEEIFAPAGTPGTRDGGCYNIRTDE